MEKVFEELTARGVGEGEEEDDEEEEGKADLYSTFLYGGALLTLHKNDQGASQECHDVINEPTSAQSHSPPKLAPNDEQRR